MPHKKPEDRKAYQAKYQNEHYIPAEKVLKYGIRFVDDPDEYRKRQSLHARSKNPVGYLLRQAKHRAKKADEAFTVEENELVVPTHCPVFGIPLFFSAGKRGPNSYSLDRVDNSKGYVKGNVRVISFWANQMKGNMTIDQVSSLLDYMTSQKD